jgi:hypothetical protein
MEKKNNNNPAGKNTKSQTNQAKVSGIGKTGAKKLQGNEDKTRQKKNF